jgi:putative hemolysin
MTIDDFNETVGTALPTDGPHTLAGLVFDRLGRRPVEGDEVDVGGTRLAVRRLDGLRIAELAIEPVRAAEAG